MSVCRHTSRAQCHGVSRLSATYALRCLSVGPCRRAVSTFQSLAMSPVSPRLDYGNAALVGLPAFQYQQLQSVIDAGARLLFGADRWDHVRDPAAPSASLVAG
jgi:hypothetical protein